MSVFDRGIGAITVNKMINSQNKFVHVHMHIEHHICISDVLMFMSFEIIEEF